MSARPARLSRCRRSPRQARAMRGRKCSLVGTAGRHGEFDAANADGDERADLEQLAADGAAAGLGQVGRLQGDAAQAIKQHISHRGEPQPQLIGLHGGRGGAVGEHIHLTFFDAVLHLAAGAIDRFIEMPAITIGVGQRDDDEPWIGLAFGPLGGMSDILCKRPL